MKVKEETFPPWCIGCGKEFKTRKECKEHTKTCKGIIHIEKGLERR